MHTETILGTNLFLAYQYAQWDKRYFRLVRQPKTLADRRLALEFNRIIRLWIDYNMPANRRPKNTAYNMVWIRVELNDAEKEDFKKWYNDSQQDFGKLIETLLIAGDKITFSYNEQQDTFYATIMGTDKSAHNNGKGFSSYAKDALLALGLALYKYSVILEGDFSDMSSDNLPDFG